MIKADDSKTVSNSHKIALNINKIILNYGFIIMYNSKMMSDYSIIDSSCSIIMANSC